MNPTITLPTEAVRAHYRSAIRDAEANSHLIDTLHSQVKALLNKPRDTLANPAMFYRHKGADKLLPHPQPKAPQHWAAIYLKFFYRPTFQNALEALQSIAVQTADRDANHSAPDKALFTTAAHNVILRIDIPADLIALAESHRLVPFTAALARAATPESYPQEQYRDLTIAAFTAALHQAEFYEGKEDNTVVQTSNPTGNLIYATRPYAALQHANTLGMAITFQKWLPSDDAKIKSLQELNRNHHGDWRNRSVIVCAEDAVPTAISQYLAQPPQLSQYQVIQLARVGREIMARYPKGRHPDTQPIRDIAVMPDHLRVSPENQPKLLEKLDSIVRAYDQWQDRMTHFDAYSDPSDEELEKLETEHHDNMARYAQIMVAASFIDQPELTRLRDAVMMSASGHIHEHCRTEYDTFFQHGDPNNKHRNYAVARIETASSIIRATPLTVLEPTAQAALLQHDLKIVQK